jgi:hypothetical protein
MSIVGNKTRQLLLATIFSSAVLLIAGCSTGAMSDQNTDSKSSSPGFEVDPYGAITPDEDNSNGDIVEQIQERENKFEDSFKSSHMKEPGELHDMDFDMGSHEVREFGDQDLEETTPLDNPVPGPLINHDACYYTAKRNVNCRASDYPQSTWIAILMQGEMANLLYINPIFTHGKFELQDSSQCWISLGFMEGPSDPLKTCNVYVVDAPPPGEDSSTGGDSPVCTADLDEASCTAAGGTWVNGGAAAASYCNCSG